MSDLHDNVNAPSLKSWTVLDVLHEAFAVVDAAGVIRYCNSAWQRLFAAEEQGDSFTIGSDYLRGFERLVGSNSDAGSAMSAAMFDLLQARSDIYESEYSYDNGQRERWLALTMLPYLHEGARALIIQQRDITARKQSEAELHARESHFRTLFEHSPDAIYVEDLNGYVLDANPAACRLNGLSHEQIIGRHVLDLVPAEMQEEVRSRLPQQINGEQPVVESLSWSQDGRVTPVEIRTTAFLYSGQPALLLHVRDISERKRYEALLVEREQQIRRRQAALLQLARHGALTGGDLTQAFQAITEAAANALDADRVSIWLYNDDGTNLRCADLFERAGQRHYAGTVIIEQDYPAYFHALKTERTIVANDVFSHPATSEFSPAYLRPLGINSLLDAQILLGDRLIGAICHSHVGPPRQWTADEENFAASIADMAALALETWERRQAEAALRRHSATIELLREIATAANESLHLEEALRKGVALLCRYTGWPVGHAYLPDPTRQGLLVSAPIWHLDDPEQFASFRRISEATTLGPGVDLPGRVLAGKQPIWVEDVQREENFPRAHLGQAIGVRGGFGLPVLVGAEVVAVLEFFSTQPAPIDQSLLEVLGSIGTQLGHVAERERADREQARLKEAVIEAQAAALAELSTPLFPVSGDVVVMPLIGSIDSARAQRIIEALLRGVTTQRARLAIIDITGVTVVDSQVADALLQAAQAVRLLGCEAMLTGIRPEVAETLIGLNNDLRAIATRSSLQSGIEYALSRRSNGRTGG